jgi:Lysyl oxidase
MSCAAKSATGCMLRHPDHKHWHFDAMASYSLRRAGSSRSLVSRDKVSFCLRDNYKVPGQRVVVPRRHFGRCSRSSQQGISSGWVDIYKADLSGQRLGECGILLRIERDQQIVRHLPTMADIREEMHGREC